MIRSQLSDFRKNLLFQSVTIFDNHSFNENTLTITLKAQLHFENELDDLLKKFFSEKYFDRFNNFESKLFVARELELIDEEIYRLIDKLRKIRNKYSHDLNFIFEEEHYNEFLSVVSADTKKTIITFVDSVYQSQGAENEVLARKYKSLLSYVLMQLIDNKLHFISRVQKKAQKLAKAENRYFENEALKSDST